MVTWHELKTQPVETWHKVRERRLFRIVVGYVAAGWLVLQGVDQMVGRLILPEVAYRLTLVVYLAGIPASMIVGWFHGEKGHQSVTRVELLLLSTLFVVTVVAGAGVVQSHAASQGPALERDSLFDLRRLAVLYFEDLSEDREFGYLADGLTEGLIEQLERVRELDVVSAKGVRPYREAPITIDSIARALHSGTVIEGSVEPEGHRADGGPRQIRVTTRLYDGESGSRIRQSAFVVPAEDLLAARDSLAREMSRTLRIWLGDEVELRDRRAGTEDLTAWTLHQRGNRARRVAEKAFSEHDSEAAARAVARADSLYALAARVDSTWADPVIERGWLAYRRSRTSHELRETVPAIEEGLRHAESALARSPSSADPGHARALELRGTLRYWKAQLPLTHDPAEHRALLASAVEDLRVATEDEPGLARAHSVLSHYHYTRRDLPAVLLAARAAYREDAYLDDADRVLWRLFLANYDLGQFNRARNWCEEATARFPRNPRVALCPLYLLTAPTVEPDVEAAWRAYARVDSLLPAGQAHAFRNLAQVLVGAVIGRSGVADSARSVLVDARLPTELRDLDPNLDLVALEAFARTRFGDYDAAIDLLRRYVAASHGFERGGIRHWWWEELREHPRFGELETEGH